MVIRRTRMLVEGSNFGRTAADKDLVTIDNLWELVIALSNGNTADSLRRIV